MSDELTEARALIERVGSEPPKSLDGAITATESNRATITFSVFGVLDSHHDIVMPGAFTKSLAERGHKLPLIWNHDLSAPSIGMVHAIQEVGRDALRPDVLARFPEATGAMMADVEFFDTPQATSIYAGVKKGSPYQASYGYDAPKKSYKQLPNGIKARLLEEIRCHELTVCHFGSNPATYLSKAGELIAAYEHKAGARHSAADVDDLNEIGARVVRLGATNIALIEAAPQAIPTRTSTVSDLLTRFDALREI